MHNISSKIFFKDILDNANDMVFLLHISDGYIEYVNETAMKKFGYTQDEMNAIGIQNIREPINNDDTFLEHLQELQANGEAVDYAYITKKDGTKFPVEVVARVMKKQGVMFNVAIARDITERMEAQRKIEELQHNLENLVELRTQQLKDNISILKSYKQAMDESSIVSKSDMRGIITEVNNKFCEISGFTREECIGKSHRIIRHPDTDPSVFKELWDAIQGKKTWKGMIKNRKKNGQYYWVDIAILPILDAAGNIKEFIAIRHDITEIMDQKEMIREIANKDALTDIKNRYCLMNDINELKSSAIALFDIVKFSEINDFYGYKLGDVLLGEIAQTIKKSIRDEKSKDVYRIHGDQFAVLNYSMNHERFVQRIQELLNELEQKVYTLNHQEIKIQFVVGISFEFNNLVNTADMALKRAKQKKIDLLIYDDEVSFDKEYENNLKWSNKLRQAIETDNLLPYYQAIVNNKTLEWEKYESLVRIIDENGEVISPFFFLEIAKNTRYYDIITKTMIKKSFEMFENSSRSFSVNLSVKDILNPEIANYIIQMLENYSSGERVVFEIVESEEIENYEAIKAFIFKVKGFGSKIAIDDFGSGYSNFNYILEIQTDFIKIDASLIKHIHQDKNARILVETIVSFAKKMNIATIAEYVENEEIFKIVQEIDIDYSQGYYFSKPEAQPRFDC
jgi:PAS domain S-box-containing protein/diguanylate cyclase (GGDEF)-like protein